MKLLNAYKVISKIITDRGKKEIKKLTNERNSTEREGTKTEKRK